MALFTDLLSTWGRILILSPRLVHWCHGAPGVGHLLLLAHSVFGDQKYLSQAAAAADVVWRRGLVRKGYGLCHGPAGNAYLFLHLHQVLLQWEQKMINTSSWQQRVLTLFV